MLKLIKSLSDANVYFLFNFETDEEIKIVQGIEGIKSYPRFLNKKEKEFVKEKLKNE